MKLNSILKRSINKPMNYFLKHLF